MSAPEAVREQVGIKTPQRVLETPSGQRQRGFRRFGSLKTEQQVRRAARSPSGGRHLHPWGCGEMVDAPGLGPGSSLEWGFESPRPQKCNCGEMVDPPGSGPGLR